MELNNQCLALASQLTSGIRSSSLVILKHHVYEPRHMIITTENQIRVDSYDWDPDQKGRRNFRGFPDQVQLSSVSGARVEN